MASVFSPTAEQRRQWYQILKMKLGRCSVYNQHEIQRIRISTFGNHTYSE